jgi:glutathione S-transferase
MRLLELEFRHQPLSVFRDFERFRDINPLVKVPTLITDSDLVLVDSSLILDYLEELVAPGRSLVPVEAEQRLHSRRLLGVSLVAMDKAVSLHYEYTQRPERLRHPGWIERHQIQLRSACDILEQAVDGAEGWLFGQRPMLADVTIAVAWTFIRNRASQDVDIAGYSSLSGFTARAERNQAFSAFPYPVE